MGKNKGYTLTLNVYTLYIKKKLHNPEEKTFKDVLVDITGETDKQKIFDAFKEKFIDSFNNQFALNTEGTKAIAIKSVGIIPSQNVVDGIVLGGLTGIEQEVYKTTSSKDKQKIIANDEVASLPYYFKLWMPFDSDIALLMIQSYTEAGVVSLLGLKIEQFFKKYKYSLASTKCIPSKYKDEFIKNSFVNQLILTRTQLSKVARSSLNGLFSDFEKLKVEIKISGLNVSVSDFLKKFDKNRPLNANLSAFEMTSPNDYSVIATYKDEKGHQSHAKVGHSTDITPTIFLPEEIKETGKQFPNYEKIQSHTQSILNDVKQEIGYTPYEVE